MLATRTLLFRSLRVSPRMLPNRPTMLKPSCRCLISSKHLHNNNIFSEMVEKHKKTMNENSKNMSSDSIENETRMDGGDLVKRMYATNSCGLI